MGYLILTSKYLDSRTMLKQFLNSMALPPSVIDKVEDLDDTVGNDANILQQVLDSALRENQDIVVGANDPTSPYFGVINARYCDRFIQLEPKVNRIVDEGRSYLG